MIGVLPGIQPDERVPSRAVMRATSVPSATWVMVRCPSTQSGPWNSASVVVRGTGAPGSSRRPEWR